MSILKTLNAQTNTGYVITFAPVGSNRYDNSAPTFIKITTAVDAYIKLIEFVPNLITPPSAPVASPAPVAGATADWYHLASDEVLTIGIERGALTADPSKFGQLEFFQFMQIWSEGAGDIKIVAQ